VSNHEFSIARLALVAFLGALILEIIVTVTIGLREPFTVRQIPVHLIALLVGALVGWFFELLREMTAGTRRLLEAAEGLAMKITYQDEALNMLLRCPQHHDALSQLIEASMSENFRYIPRIGPPDYLRFLEGAIAHANRYEGIQRKPPSWFEKVDGESYLTDLRERRMQHKTRLFIIDESDGEQWEEDLKNAKCLNYYWKNTGSAVKTYWMYTSDFRRNFPAWGETPLEDLALYDRKLLISYNESAELLYFEVLEDNDVRIRLFQSIEEMDIPALKPLSKSEKMWFRHRPAQRGPAE
jgi:hypothetical protein